MTIHRATTASGSAADARFRIDAQAMQHHIPDYHTYDLPPNRAASNPHRQPSFPKTFKSSKSQYTHTSIPDSTDPTQPLLPTTRFNSHSLPPSSQSMPDCELGDHHRMNIKSSSGTYIGLLCIVIVWLIPIGIVASGGTGEVAVRASSLFGRPEQISLENPTHFRPLIWESVRRSEHCLRFKTREYTAKSIGTGPGRVGMEECKASPAQIHGLELRPTFCEDLGMWSGIWGHWVVDFGEPDCETTWTNFSDEGCQSTTGRHRFTATLDHFTPGDNWLIMCSTTPTDFMLDGKRLPVPSNCERVRDAVVGTWDVPDKACQSAPIQVS